ncbi:MAG: methyltransferase domain-containing protein, partial [Nanoarchaeota archaeon]
MSFYDNFTKRDKISRFGKYIILKQNQFYLKLINKYSSSKKVKILEIGSGKGYFAEICKKNKFDYCAIEANYKMYRKLKNNNYNVYNQTIPPI